MKCRHSLLGQVSLACLLQQWRCIGTATRQSLSDLYRLCILGLYLKLELFVRLGDTLFSLYAKKWTWGTVYTMFGILLGLWSLLIWAASESNRIYFFLWKSTALPKDKRLELISNHTCTNTLSEAELEVFNGLLHLVFTSFFPIDSPKMRNTRPIQSSTIIQSNFIQLHTLGLAQASFPRYLLCRSLINYVSEPLIYMPSHHISSATPSHHLTLTHSCSTSDIIVRFFSFLWGWCRH